MLLAGIKRQCTGCMLHRAAYVLVGSAAGAVEVEGLGAKEGRCLQTVGHMSSSLLAGSRQACLEGAQPYFFQRAICHV